MEVTAAGPRDSSTSTHCPFTGDAAYSTVVVEADVRTELLEPGGTRTVCPYTGVAHHRSVVGGPRDAVWLHPGALPETAAARGMLCSLGDEIATTVDGERLARGGSGGHGDGERPRPWRHTEAVRARPVILHLDLDAFFTAVEQLHKPSLRGKPVVVGGVGGRGVVSTASYEARVHGIHSAMATAEARRRCPNAAYLAPRFEAYRDCSVKVMDLARALTPLVEQVSIDEAYLDLTPTLPSPTIEEVEVAAEELRRRIRAATGLTASVGGGTSKLVAKIHSDLAKPDGLALVPAGEEAARLAPMTVRAIPGVGPATAARLAANGITTVGRIAELGVEEAVALLGRAHGTQLHAFAHGIDDREVVTERAAKSVSAETTFPSDVTDRVRLGEHLRQLTARVGGRLRADGLSGRTVVLKVRRHDFSTLTRSSTLDQPTDDDGAVLRQAERLLAGVDVSDGLRLIGVGVSGLSLYTQPDLLDGLLDGLPDAPPPSPPGVEDFDRPDAGGLLESSDGSGGTVLRADVTEPEPGREAWRPGQDVEHAEHGRGWVQGSGVGRVTVRFEGPNTEVGRIRTFPDDDPDLGRVDPPVWCPEAAPGS